MTTDRTAAPARPTALPERSPAAGQKSAPPADAFSALLGAVAPRTDEAPRKPAHERRDDAPRADRPKQTTWPATRRGAATTPAAEAPATEETPVERAGARVPNLFALQLAGPLPPAAPRRRSRPRRPRHCLRSRRPRSSRRSRAPCRHGPDRCRAAAAAPTTPSPSLPVLGGLIPASALTTEPTAVVTAQPAVPVQPQTAPAADVTPEQIATALQNANAGQTQSDAQPQEQPNTAAPVATAAPQAKSADAPAPAVTTPAPQPITAPAPAAPVTAPPSLERAVPLYRAVQTTGTLLHVAAERGVTHARLNLKPVELGGIEVRLQSTPQGISAQLVADNPEAARMLSQAGEDLRRQLAERDVTLLSLDVSTSSEQRHDNSAGGFGAFGDDNYRPGFGSSRRSGGSDGESVDAAGPRPPRPPSSSLTASSSTSSPDPDRHAQ